MSQLPQELIDAILGELEDAKSLKSCSLVRSDFRYTSQRILLRSLTLKARSAKSYCAALALLEESSHIAAYITSLTVYLQYTPPSGDAEVQSLLQVLSRLPNINRFMLFGSLNNTVLTVQLSSVILDFLAGQPLQELHVLFFSRLSLPTFFRLLGAAPTIFFFQVSIPETTDNFSLDFSPHTSGLRQLYLKDESNSISELLACPQYAFHTASLTHLEVQSYMEKLLSVAAHSLEFVRFKSSHHTSRLVPLPHFPALRCVEFVIHVNELNGSQFTDAISNILVPSVSPRLAEMIIKLFPIPTTFVRTIPISSFIRQLDLIAALDTALVGHPGSPLISWRLDLPYDYGSAFDDFVAFMQGAMPKAHDQNRISFGMYAFQKPPLPYLA